MSRPLLQAIGDNVKIYVSHLGSSMSFSTNRSGESKLRSDISGESKLSSKDKTTDTVKRTQYTGTPVATRGSDDILLSELRTSP